MKKLTFTLFLLLASLLIAAQQVPRDKVILEIATGTWCQYCPGAAMGADDLIENGCEVAVIEYHNNDNFDNDASNARNSYYNVGGFPTAHFDGVVTYVGGDQFVSMYSNYLPLYQGRIAIESSFTMQIYGDNSGDDYTIGVMVTKVADGPDVVTLQLALTESNIVFSWMGQDHVNFVERLMAPDAQGTELDFSNTDEIYTELTFTKDASWVLNNCELVSFLQDESDKEIQQGTKVALNNLQPLVATARFVADNTLPCVTTNVNYTDESLGQIISWNWTFEGGNPPASTLQNPVVSYNTPGFYDAQLIVYDGTVYDTLLSVNYIEAITVPSTPNTPSGPTELCQSDGSVVYSTNYLPHTTSYLWTVTPSNAGTIFGTGTQGTFTLAQGYVGTFDIKVRADNQCGYGTFSEALSAQSFYTPVQYTLSDGGGYCEGDPGIDVTQDGS